MRIIPLVVSEASRGRTAPLEALLGLQGGGVSNMSAMMHRAVYCREDYPFSGTTVSELRARDADSAEVLEFWTRTCALLDVPPAPVSRRAPIDAAVPSLVLSGQYDPVAPPEWSRATAGRLASARYAALPSQGHVVWYEPCGDEITARFIEDPLAPVATSCLDDIPGPRFVTLTNIAPTAVAYRLRTKVSPGRHASPEETGFTGAWLLLLIAELGLTVALLSRDQDAGRWVRVVTHGSGAVVSGLHFGFLAGLRGAIDRASDEFILDYGIPVDSAHVLLLPWLAGLATVGLLVLVVASRSARSGPRASRWLSRVVGAAAIGQLVWLWSWGAL